MLLYANSIYKSYIWNKCQIVKNTADHNLCHIFMFQIEQLNSHLSHNIKKQSQQSIHHCHTSFKSSDQPLTSLNQLKPVTSQK